MVSMNFDSFLQILTIFPSSKKASAESAPAKRKRQVPKKPAKPAESAEQEAVVQDTESIAEEDWDSRTGTPPPPLNYFNQEDDPNFVSSEIVEEVSVQV